MSGRLQLFSLGVLILITGCVSSSKYRQETERANRLAAQLAQMTQENQSLSQQLKATQEAKEAEVNRVKGTYEQLVGGLQNELAAGQVKITQLAGKLSVNLVEKILFGSGQARLKSEGEAVLDRVGAVLKQVQDKDIRIEGHTDNVPIGKGLQSKFASNWELSSARATAVARYLTQHAGIDPQRLIAAGYGEYRPIAPNDTDEHRAENRRIEIVLVPREPVATSATSSLGTQTPVQTDTSTPVPPSSLTEPASDTNKH